MTTLKKLWIEHNFGEKRAIRIDWKNDRHQRIEIKDDTPEAVARALKQAGALVDAERLDDENDVELWECTKCRQISPVGRCCGVDTRTPAKYK